MSETYALIAGFLTDRFGVDAADVQPESTLEQLDLDSLALAELAVIVEDALGIRIAEDPPLNPGSTLAEAAAIFEKAAAESRVASGQ